MLTPVLLGAGGWSLSEYVLHRWVGHDPRSQTEFAKEHRAHHAQRFYFAPTAKKAAYVAPIMLAGGALAWWLAGVAGAAFVASYAVTYGSYELLHRRLHTHGPRGRIGRFLRRHHVAHHFNGPQTNHGVTSPVWDVVFRTLRAPGLIKVPSKLAMTWLTNPETGEALPEYASDYVVVQPVRAAAA